MIEIVLLTKFTCTIPAEKCCTPSVDLNNDIYLVRQHFVSEHSVQAKMFSYCIVVLE